MRRILVIATALLVLGATAAAYAAAQPYTGGLVFSSKKAGTAKKPVGMGFGLTVRTTTPAGTRPPVQLDIKIKIYGLKLDGKDFPRCSLNTIAGAHKDTVCPKKAKVAGGAIMSLLGDANDFSVPGADCDPALDVWNSGQGKMTYFFVTDATHQCLGGALHTGSTPPYPGTYKQVGKYFEANVEVPSYINYPTGGLVGSLQYEHLNFTSQSKKLGHKRIYSQESVGCLKGKRPYSITTTTTGGAQGSQNVVSTISGSAPC